MNKLTIIRNNGSDRIIIPIEVRRAIALSKGLSLPGQKEMQSVYYDKDTFSDATFIRNRQRFSYQAKNNRERIETFVPEDRCVLCAETGELLEEAGRRFCSRCFDELSLRLQDGRKL